MSKNSYLSKIRREMYNIKFTTWQMILGFQLLCEATSLIVLCCFYDHHYYKVACALFPSAIDVCNKGNILQERGVKFANINLVLNWTPMFQLNELPFKCSRPWLHTFNPGVNLIWSRRAVQRHNPLIDKADRGKTRVKEQKLEPGQWRGGEKRGKGRYGQRGWKEGKKRK